MSTNLQHELNELADTMAKFLDGYEQAARGMGADTCATRALLMRWHTLRGQQGEQHWRVVQWVLGGDFAGLRLVVERNDFYDWAHWTLLGASLQAVDPDTRAALSWASEMLEALHLEALDQGSAQPSRTGRKPRPRSGCRSMTIQ